ncbi:hypothetical protein ACM66B_004215 [Microbotryomycetes sp. NB124-2]
MSVMTASRGLPEMQNNLSPSPLSHECLPASRSPLRPSPPPPPPVTAAQLRTRRSKVGMFQLGPSSSSIDDDSFTSLTAETTSLAGAKTLLKASLDRASKQRVLFVPGQMARVLSPEEVERLTREEEEILMSGSSGRPSLDESCRSTTHVEEGERDDGADGDWETDDEDQQGVSRATGHGKKHKPRPAKPSDFLSRLARSAESQESPVQLTAAAPLQFSAARCSVQIGWPGTAAPTEPCTSRLSSPFQHDSSCVSLGTRGESVVDTKVAHQAGDNTQPLPAAETSHVISVGSGHAHATGADPVLDAAGDFSRSRKLNSKGSAVLTVTVPLVNSSNRLARSSSAPEHDPSGGGDKKSASAVGETEERTTQTVPPPLNFVRRPTMTRQSSLGGTFSQLYASDVQAKRDQAMRIRQWQKEGGASKRGSRHNSRSNSSTNLYAMAPTLPQFNSTELADSPVSATSDEGEHGEGRDVVCDTFEVSVFASPGSNSATSLSQSSASSMFWSAQSASPSPSPLSPTSSASLVLGYSPPKANAVDGHTTPRALTRVAPFRPTFPVTSTSTTSTPVMSRASSRARVASSSPVRSKAAASEDYVVAAFNRLAMAQARHEEAESEQRGTRSRSRQASFASSSSSGYSTPMRAGKLPLTPAEQRKRSEALATLGLDAEGQPRQAPSNSIMSSIKRFFSL